MNNDIKPYNYIFFALCLILGFLLETVIGMTGLICFRESSYYDLGILGMDSDILGSLLFIPIFIIIPFSTAFIFAVSTKISGIGIQRFPPVITSTCEKVNNEYLDPKDVFGTSFYAADDHQLVVRHKDRKTYIRALIVAIAIITFMGIYGIVDTGEGKYAFWLGLSFVLMLHLLYNIFYPAKYVIFDRMTGLVTIPGLSVFPHQKIPFEKVRQGNVFYMAGKFMGVINTFTWTAESIPGRMNSGWWSFYVWYMDKNRPLPHGTLLDPYREKDFLRRQAEGFPPPLYEAGWGVTISDDRYGYLYATDEFKALQRSFRIPVASAYRMVHQELWEKDKTITEESIVLIGIWKGCYVFCRNVPLNPKLQLFTDVSVPDGSMFIEGKKGKFYNDYTLLINK
jgi:hypothetical protein